MTRRRRGGVRWRLNLCRFVARTSPRAAGRGSLSPANSPLAHSLLGVAGMWERVGSVGCFLLAGALATACGGSVSGGAGSGAAAGTGGSGATGATGGAAGTGGHGGSGGSGGTIPVPPCCTGDLACGPSMECVQTVCEPVLDDACWRDSDCGPNAHCDGASVCPCMADCIAPDTPGQCVPDVGNCCKTDTDCGDFAYVPCVSGRCKVPVPDACWTDAECAGGACIGAVVCPCGSQCKQPDKPGSCAYPAD